MPDVASDMICAAVRIGIGIRGLQLGKGMGLPSSRTSTIAILEGGVEASRLEDVWERRIWERSVEERRGRVAIVWVVILRINGPWRIQREGRCWW